MSESTLGVKLYLNGFPKSGLHLARQMALCYCRPLFLKNWVGTFKANGWSSEWVDLDRPLKLLAALGVSPMSFTKGHSGYHPVIAGCLRSARVCTVFVYRDFRDVAVSQMYHILSDDDERFVHPGKDKYRALGNKDAVLRAVITGLDEYPGLITRWAQYASWLDQDWVLALSYEDMRLRPEIAAGRFLEHMLSAYDIALSSVEDMELETSHLVDALGDTHKASTFRRGLVGGWKEYFNPELEQVFKDHDIDNWLERLGYAWEVEYA